MKARTTVAISLTVLAYPIGAHALCIYGGKHFEKSGQPDFQGRLYAKTRLQDEFQDAALVVKATVLSSREIPLAEEESNSDAQPGVVYQLRISRTFKGRSATELDNFSERDSGGFYLDVGTQYLLFLDPMRQDDWARRVAPGALRVNYNCGQSRPWKDVGLQARKQLNRLALRVRPK